MDKKNILELSNVDRKKISDNLRNKYHNRIPIIVTGKQIVIRKQKFLAPNDITIQQLQHTIRKYIDDLKSHEGIFLFIDNIILNGSTLMSEIYRTYKKEDGFIYIIVSKESVFG